MKQMLGIIGGMGSFAGLSLVEYALKRAVVNGAKCDEDFPKLVYYNIPVTGLAITGVVDEKALFKHLRNAVSHLETIGCRSIIIACASAHVMHAKLQGLADAKIFNLVEIGCHNTYPGIVGVMCSESSRKAGLFDRHLKACVYPDPEDQQLVNHAIEAVMFGRQGSDEANDLQTVAFNLRAKGATEILLGCTELPIAINRHLTTMRMVDAGKFTVDEALHG